MRRWTKKILEIGIYMINLKQPEIIHNRYQHRFSADSYNTSIQAPIALEETWSIRRWENRAFAIMFDLLEVIAKLGENYLGGLYSIRPMLEFRRLISRDLINNLYLRQDDPLD